MYYTTFMKWMWNKLSDIHTDDMMEETDRFDYRENDGKYILAVPATGEEIYFEVYGVDPSGGLVLLVEREL